MYNSYFGFETTPFSLSPDTNLFVNLQGHQECFQLMCFALESGEGFLKVVGDVGTGKTILCRKLLKHLHSQPFDNEVVTVYIPNPYLTPKGLMSAVISELNIDDKGFANPDEQIELLNKHVLNLAKDNKSIVIIVDEAQALPDDTLEALRLITNLETETQKLVQIVLIGQIELDDILNTDRFRQLNQRITFSHYLQPLTPSSTDHYIRHRLMRAGFSGEPLFSNKAIKTLFKYTHGVPRMINVIGHKSLLSAYAKGRRNVTSSDIKNAYLDTNKSSKPKKSKFKSIVLWGLTFILVALMANQLYMVM